ARLTAGTAGRVRPGCDGAPDPARVTLRRLTRAESNTTIRDLIGISFRPADSFPSDDVGYGFDNIGDVLSMPPLLMEKYLAAADKVVHAAWQDEAARKRVLVVPLDDKSKVPAVRQIVRTFAERAWRRPVSEDEVKRLARFVEISERSGDSPEAGIQLAMQAVLGSPNFPF